MPLPAGFQFSQSCLQIYLDCQKRFELLYLKRTVWPAVQEEPALEAERRERLGRAFHRIAQQDILGIPRERLSACAAANPLGGEELEAWWKSYQQCSASLPVEPSAKTAVRKLPEVSLTAPADFGGFGSFPYRITAKFDALALVDCPGEQRRAAILDWKTSRWKTRREKLEKTVQTRLYPLLLVISGAHLNGGKPFDPERIEMIYWFAGYPEQPERFPYNASRFESDCAYLAGLIAEIESGVEKGFLPTEDVGRCLRCVYRSLCERGDRAGEIDPEDELEIEIDF